jgi:hypothetical protein
VTRPSPAGLTTSGMYGKSPPKKTACTSPAATTTATPAMLATRPIRPTVPNWPAFRARLTTAHSPAPISSAAARKTGAAGLLSRIDPPGRSHSDPTQPSGISATITAPTIQNTPPSIAAGPLQRISAEEVMAPLVARLRMTYPPRPRSPRIAAREYPPGLSDAQSPRHRARRPAHTASRNRIGFSQSPSGRVAMRPALRCARSVLESEAAKHISAARRTGRRPRSRSLDDCRTGRCTGLPVHEKLGSL